MGKEIIIGSIAKTSGTAIHIFELEGKHSISDAGSTYWISDLIFDYSMKVHKDTPEGKQISDGIYQGVGAEEILAYLNGIVLSQVPVKLVLDHIKHKELVAFENGRRSKLKELRDFLGIY